METRPKKMVDEEKEKKRLLLQEGAEVTLRWTTTTLQPASNPCQSEIARNLLLLLIAEKFYLYAVFPDIMQGTTFCVADSELVF